MLRQFPRGDGRRDSGERGPILSAYFRDRTLGLWVLSGRHLPQAALATVLLNSIYAVWMAVSLARGLDLPNCGCYGVYFPQPLRWYSPLEDLVLITLGLTLRRLAR